MRYTIIMCWLFFFSNSSIAQFDQQFKTIFLVGDAGDPRSKLVLDELKRDVESSQNSLILYLGDNLYPAGLKTNLSNKASLDSQIFLIDTMKAYASVFIPGNHDWKSGKAGGLKRINGQQAYIESQANINPLVKDRIDFLPKSGSPGPAKVQLNDGLDLIVVDSQWYLQKKWGKVGEDKSLEKFILDLEKELAASAAENNKVIIAMHHPFYSAGSHGTKKSVMRFFSYYLPVLQVVPGLVTFGQINPYRLLSQDITHPRFTKFKKAVLETVKNSYSDKVVHGEIFFVSGHQHNLQYWQGTQNQHFLVSGSAAKEDPYLKKLIPTYEKELKGGLVFPESTLLDTSPKQKIPSLRGYIKMDIANSDNIGITVKYYDGTVWQQSSY